MKNCLGIEIGHYRIKIAYAENGELREFISERVEGIDRNDMRQYADLIKDLLKEYAIRCRNVVFVIRQEDAYVRRFELPLMTEEQLRLNLPYEFHDYIGNEMDKYVFDYAMIYADQEKMDLIGAACTKELSQQFEKLAKMAHLKLVGLVPAVLGLEWILEYAEERMADEKKALETKLNAEPHKKEEKENAEGAEKSETVKDYAILDLGTQALRIHFFRQGIYDITRTMEPGCEEIEQIRLGDKNKMQELGIEVEEENREETDKEKMAAVLEEQYRTRAVQVMRVLNFYSFNNVNNTIDSLYYCGGGARYGELIDALKETLDLPVRSVAELLPEVSLDEEESKLPDRRMMLDSLKSQIFPLTAVSSVSITSDQMSLEGTIPNGTLFSQLVRDAQADPNARYVTASLEETVKKDGEERALASLKQVGVSMAVFFNEPEEGKEK